MNDILVGNLSSLFATVTDSISGTRKNQKSILLLQSLSQIFYGAAAIILKGYSSAVQNVVGILRNFAAMWKIKSKVVEWILIAMGVVFGFVFNNRGLLGWLPIVANLEYSVCVFRFEEDERSLKIAFVINMVMYGVFSLLIMNYVGAVSCTIIATTTTIALIKEKRKGPKADSASDDKDQLKP